MQNEIEDLKRQLTALQISNTKLEKCCADTLGLLNKKVDELRSMDSHLENRINRKVIRASSAGGDSHPFIRWGGIFWDESIYRFHDFGREIEVLVAGRYRIDISLLTSRDKNN